MICFSKNWGLLFLFMPLISFAHPHAFVDTAVTLIGNQTHITHLHMRWTFDPMTTAYMYDGYDLSQPKKAQTLQIMASSVIKNLRNTHYFLYFFDGDKPIKYKTVNSAVIEDHHHQATLSFDIELSHPQPLTKDSLNLMIYDPTYYIDLYWNGREDIHLSPELAKSCFFKILAPHPTTEQMNYAVSLSVEEHGDDALGQLFTQKLQLDCHLK